MVSIHTLSPATGIILSDLMTDQGGKHYKRFSGMKGMDKYPMLV
jgi:hypothetical protein